MLDQTSTANHKQSPAKPSRHNFGIPFASYTAFKEATEKSSEPQNSIRKGFFAVRLLQVAEKQRNERVFACRLSGIRSRKGWLASIMAVDTGNIAPLGRTTLSVRTESGSDSSSSLACWTERSSIWVVVIDFAGD